MGCVEACVSQEFAHELFLHGEHRGDRVRLEGGSVGDCSKGSFTFNFDHEEPWLVERGDFLPAERPPRSLEGIAGANWHLTKSCKTKEQSHINLQETRAGNHVVIDSVKRSLDPEILLNGSDSVISTPSKPP